MLSISRRNFITLGAGLFATGALAGCGGGSSAEGSSSSEGGSSAASGTYKIGVLQLTEHGALDQTNEASWPRWMNPASTPRLTSRTRRTTSPPARPSRASS